MMSSIVQVILTKLSTGETFEGMAWCDSGRYEAIWHEGGLRHVFLFDLEGKQIGSNRYSLKRADT